MEELTSVQQIKATVKNAWKPLFMISLSFMTTFIIFPGCFLQSSFDFMSSLGDSEFTWYSLFVVIAFNIIDTVGRQAGGICKPSNCVIYLLGFLRLVFIATTVYIPLAERQGDTSFITSDGFKLANLFLFSISNGFVSTVLAIKAPGFVPPKQREQLGTSIGLFLIIGIASGSLIAIPLGQVLTPPVAALVSN